MVYFKNTWWPIVPAAIAQLPRGAKFDHRALQWTNQAAPAALGHNSLAALVVDLDLTGKAGQLSDVQLEFGSTGWRIRSLLGYSQFRYGDGRFDLDAATLNPAWGAWKPAFLAILGASAALAIFAGWIILATLGAPFAKLMSFFADRDLTLGQAWKVCGAALMPGALFFSAAIALYTFMRLNLFGLALAALIHLAIDAIYMLLAPCRLSKKVANEPSFARPSNNPFNPTEPKN